MKRIGEIKARRERAFWKNRMAPNKSLRLTEQATEIKNHLNLIQPRTTTTSETEGVMAIEERDKIREKIKVNAAQRPGVTKTKQLRKTALVPADGGGMGMGMGMTMPKGGSSMETD